MRSSHQEEIPVRIHQPLCCLVSAIRSLNSFRQSCIEFDPMHTCRVEPGRGRLNVRASASSTAGPTYMLVQGEAAKLTQTKLLSVRQFRSYRSLWILLVASFVLLLWASIQIAGNSANPVADTLAVSIGAVTWLAIFGVTTSAAFGTPYLFVRAYVIALVAFHFGLIVQDGFGLLNVAGYRGQAGMWITLAGWYTNLALGCLGIGFAWGCLTFPSDRPISREVASRLAADNLARLRNLALGLCFACFAFLIIGLAQVGNPLKYDRYTLFFGGNDIRGLGVFNWLAPSAAIAIVISARTRLQKGWSYIGGACVLCVFLLAGNRSMAFFPLLVGVSSLGQNWATRYPPYPWQQP